MQRIGSESGLLDEGAPNMRVYPPRKTCIVLLMSIVGNHSAKQSAVRVILDTNVFVSAAVFGGVPNDIVFLCRAGVVQAGVSDVILEELNDVLERKFGWEDEDVGFLEEKIFSFAEYVESGTKIRMPKLSAGDRKILETAIAFDADFVVSGDNDLLQLGTFKGIQIVTPREFMDGF